MSIPFVDLKAQLKVVEAEIRAGFDRVFEHCRFIMGQEVFDLEKDLAEFCGAKHCISCSNGTTALIMPLIASNIETTDAVFTTPFTFVATAEVISLARATPVFVDIDPDTYNIDPQKLEDRIREVKKKTALRPKAIIPVDLFGLPADYDAIMDIAARHDLLVIDDAAQGFGGVYKGRRLGSIAHVTGTSFFPAKPLGCYGDGGAIFTNDDDLAAKLTSIRIHGMGGHQYENVRIGINGRLDTFQAVVLLAKLRIFQTELDARQRVAERYTAGLSDLVKTPHVPDAYRSAWAQYSIQTDRRDELRTALQAEGVPTAIYYPLPLHLQKAYAHLGYAKGDFPVSEAASERIMSLPMHPYLDDASVDQIIAAVRKVLV